MFPFTPLDHAGVLQVGERDLQGGQDLHCQQVEAGASVDQHLGDLEVVDDGRHDQGQCPYPDGAVRMIFRVEGNDLVGPLQWLQRRRGDRVQLSDKSLASAVGGRPASFVVEDLDLSLSRETEGCLSTSMSIPGGTGSCLDASCDSSSADVFSSSGT